MRRREWKWKWWWLLLGGGWMDGERGSEARSRDMQTEGIRRSEMSRRAPSHAVDDREHGHAETLPGKGERRRMLSTRKMPVEGDATGDSFLSRSSSSC